MCSFCWQLTLFGANFLLPARTALLQSSEETFFTTWISILAQLLVPKLANLETEGYQSSSLPFMAGDGLSTSYAPALLECSLKGSAPSLVSANVCIPQCLIEIWLSPAFQDILLFHPSS